MLMTKPETKPETKRVPLPEPVARIYKAIAELEAASFEARVAIGLRLHAPLERPAAMAFGEGRRGH